MQEREVVDPLQGDPQADEGLATLKEFMQSFLPGYKGLASAAVAAREQETRNCLPGAKTASPDEKMIGHDDWSNLRLSVSDGGGAFRGPVPPDELTDGLREILENHEPDPLEENQQKELARILKAAEREIG